MLKLPVKGSIFSPCDRPSPSTFPDRRPFSVSIKPVKYFFGRKIAFDFPKKIPANRSSHAAPVEMTLTIAKAMRWWEKGIQPNMMEIGSAQELVETLSVAGDKLVIVDFFSPGCAGCRALHPKICQFAEKNSDVLFLQVNYEMHKSMCYSLNVHVLPFFRFYRGAHGRLCSFSCTVATIKKFKDALAKHSTDRCSIGPVKGLEESELLALAANKDLRFNYTKKEEVLRTGGEVMEPVSVFDLSPVSISLHGLEEKTLAATRR